MRLLLDECVPKRLKREWPGHEVKTVQDMGWAGIKYGALLKLAAAGCVVQRARATLATLRSGATGNGGSSRTAGVTRLLRWLVAEALRVRWVDIAFVSVIEAVNSRAL